MKIGFYDSGIGGLSVLNYAIHTLPEEEYLYYADVDHVPYGTKTKEQIISFADSAVSFMISKNVKAIVVACNTATSVAIKYLRDKYRIPILGMEPAVKPAVARNRGKRVLVIATPLTVREAKLQNLIKQVDSDHVVDLLPLSGLVPFAENMEFNSPAVKAYLKKEFEPFNLEDYSQLVLGCTHFNYFKDTLSEILPTGIEFIGGTKGTITHLKNTLTKLDLIEKNDLTVDYYFSGREVVDSVNLKRIETLHNRLERMYLIDNV